RSDRMVRLSREEARRFGLGGEADDVLVLRVSGDGDPMWLFVFSRTIDDPSQARLTLYAAMLRESLGEIRQSARKRIAATLTDGDHGQHEGTKGIVEAALAHLRAGIGASQAALHVTSVTGTRVLTYGDAVLFGNSDRRPARERMVVTSSDDVSIL